MVEEKIKKECSVTSLYRSRKSFLPEYLCGFFLFGATSFFFLKSLPFSNKIGYILLGLTVIAFASTEISRLLVHYQITPEKVIITEGIFKKHKKNVHFHPLGFVPDINVRQNFIQRLFGYGTIFVHGSGEHHLEIKDVNHPHYILSTLEKLIDTNRTPSTKRRG
ncbi:MAG: PH domain-containing protein [Nanoarchaeota archaeon]|nr:PH domain-containing protein [Nanoarchaeota archaeon]MBU1622090.1 PH domain-containing protein [Nanoarchaeota archaeon]MBU1973876.1 PH domain-containing protein [Nanoarchaeota archaeon]